MGLGDIHWTWLPFLERTTAASQDLNSQAPTLPTVPGHKVPLCLPCWC